LPEGGDLRAIFDAVMTGDGGWVAPALPFAKAWNPLFNEVSVVGVLACGGSMRTRIVSVAVVVVSLISAGCGGRAGNKAGLDGGGAGTTGGGGGGRAQTDGGADRPSGPPITTAPPDWVRPADCLGVGQTCDLGCASGAICQLDGYVCIPKPGANGPAGQAADTPYCLAYSCMTFDQASCFCTGPAGAQYEACAYGPAAVAGLCAVDGVSCNDTPCCEGLRCTAISPTSRVCYKPCAHGSDCASGCCTDLRDTGDLECAPASACQNPCVKRGGSCTSGSTTCCNGTCVESTAPDQAGCRPVCSTSADCDTGCCVLFANQPIGFCTSIGYCGCGAGCAAGSSCLSFDGSNFGCYKDCKEDTDCPGQCCTSDIPGKDHGSCVTSTSCCPGGCSTGQSCLNVDNHPACYKNCQQPSECSTDCCSLPPAGGTYGGCLPASKCGL
jgi:hypothetical protein